MITYYGFVITDCSENSTITGHLANESWDGQRKDRRIGSSPEAEKVRRSKSTITTMIIMMMIQFNYSWGIIYIGYLRVESVT